MLIPSLQYGARILRTADTRHLAKFMWNFGVKGVRSVNLFKKRMKEGTYFPPFLYISILQLQPTLPGLLGRCRQAAG